MNSTSRKQVDMLTKMSDSFGILDDQHYNYDQQSSSTTTTTTTSKTTTMTTTTTIVTSPGYMKQHQKQLQQQTQYQLANKLVNNPLDSKQIEITEAGIFVPSSSASDLQYDDNHNNNNALNGTWKAYLWLTILLRPQKFYLASDWSSAVIAFMLSLSVGCCDDPILVREQLHEPKSILCGILCQSLIIPLLALGIGIVYALDIDQAFGLFMSSTIPAGGLAYLLTYLSHGDRQLSAALSLVSSLCNLVITPIWAMTVGWYWFNRPINIGKTFGWLLLIAGAQSLGTLMRGCRPGLARAILTWVTRPLLLLSGILLVTLGVYINHYAFNEVTQSLILALLTLITCGFAVGWLVGILIKQGCTGSRTLSTASSVFNGLICMPMLRTCVHAPEGDLAAVVALWTIFFAPIPLAYHAAVTIMEKWLTSYLQNRRKKREEENCMAAMIGGKQHEFSATSVAAVAAAAIAVTPAIAAGNQHRTSKSKTSTTYSQETMNNDDYNGINSPPITTTTTTAKKTSSDTVTTPTSSMDHPLEYDNYLDTCGLHGVHNVYNDHFKSIDDNELRLSILAANNEIMLNSYKHRPPTVFEGQQTRVRRANWLTDPNQQQQQQPEEMDESAETEHLRTSHLNDRVNADSRMSITHNNSEVISEQQQQQQQNDGEDPSKTRKTGLKRSSVQPTVKNVAEKDHRHSVHVSPPYTNL
uniref:Uncharacterized protein n=1 Tax=Trichobilharzia regenti TaxID=157069 RepID=A0AA85IWD9_TRIRE|nr:unnamed protein product [Trichobilharzia regenti]